MRRVRSCLNRRGIPASPEEADVCASASSDTRKDLFEIERDLSVHYEHKSRRHGFRAKRGRFVIEWKGT